MNYEAELPRNEETRAHPPVKSALDLATFFLVTSGFSRNATRLDARQSFIIVDFVSRYYVLAHSIAKCIDK